jgi:hypothetical protein
MSNWSVGNRLSGTLNAEFRYIGPQALTQFSEHGSKLN